MTDTNIILLNLLPSRDSSYDNKGGNYPAPGIFLIGTLLKKNGYDVSIIDGAYYEDYREKLKKTIQEKNGNVLYVGLSVMVTQIPFALEASRIVKNIDKDIHVVWGGPHPTLYPEQTLVNDNVDIVVLNEGAITALSLTQCLKDDGDLSTVKGIGYKDNKNSLHFTMPAELEDIHLLPYFDFSLIDIENYLNPAISSVYQREFPQFNDTLRIMPILTGLGCPYRCQFCINVILKRKYRFRSAKSIVEEIKRLQSIYNANTFLFLDEDFFISKKRLLEFISLCEQDKIHCNFRTWCRVDHFKDAYLNKEILNRLCGIGHVSLAMGGESANPEILADLKKGITPYQIVNSLRIITDASKNIFPRYSFMVGLENESMEQIRNTYRFCMNMRSINPSVDIAGPFVFRLYPGSPIFNRLIDKYNITIPGSLEDWSKHVSSYGSFDTIPWTPQEFQKKKDYIIFYSNYALYFHRKAKNVKQLLRMLLIKLSRFRIKHFFFSLPFEFWAHSFYRSKINKRS